MKLFLAVAALVACANAGFLAGGHRNHGGEEVLIIEGGHQQRPQVETIRVIQDGGHRPSGHVQTLRVIEENGGGHFGGGDVETVRVVSGGNGGGSRNFGRSHSYRVISDGGNFNGGHGGDEIVNFILENGLKRH